jgi:phosphatidylserine decarboxylase
MLFNQMFEQVPKKPPYNKDPTGKPQVRDYRHMLQLLNTLMTHAPEFDQSCLVGCPINTIFDWSMGTAAGFAAFLNERVNAQLKKVLNGWGRFLSSSDSTYVLNQDPMGAGLAQTLKKPCRTSTRTSSAIPTNCIMGSSHGTISSRGNCDQERAQSHGLMMAPSSSTPVKRLPTESRVM